MNIQNSAANNIDSPNIAANTELQSTNDNLNPSNNKANLQHTPDSTTTFNPSNLNTHASRRNRLQAIIKISPPVQQKRQSSHSSINNQSNKRSAYFPLTSSSSNLYYIPNQHIQSPVPYKQPSQQQHLQPQVLQTPQIPHQQEFHTNPVIASQYPFLAPYQNQQNSFKPTYYRHSNTPTIATTSTNNFTTNNGASNNLNFTPASQLTPKLHYQILQSSLKKHSISTSNLDITAKNKFLPRSIPADLSSEYPVDQDQINYYSKNYKAQQSPNLSNFQKTSQSPELLDNKMSSQYNQNKNMSNSPPQYDRTPNPQPQPKQQALPAQQQQQPLPQQQQQQPQMIMSEEEQLLISNLQETYKSILKLEVETQQGCADVNQKLLENNVGSELNNELWIVYKHVVQLLDNYYDFLLYALSPASTKTGRPLVSNYRILKRMWVYGVVAFLEVLKNVVAIFVEHEVCACFVSYSFNIISCLTDPELGIECWWAEKLGDLSRMAIALYPARYMDWKTSSIYWYQEAIKTQFGHGKIYYHMCSVENDNLEALMLIGKGVNCKDPFVPTQQYLRMIVDNVCSQRNMLTAVEMAMIDFVKIHKILLLPTYSMNEEMINIVSHYSSNFGVDNTNIDFFQIRPDCTTSDINDKVTFWFQKGANFALSNIYHLMGFGLSSNPFAKLFDLPDALKERKDKKDRREKRRRSRSDSASVISAGLSSADPNDPEFLTNSSASQLNEKYWFLLLEHINKGVIELSMKMLKQYLSGPVQTSTPHAIVWLYFLISVCNSIKLYPASKPMFVKLLQAIFPWKVLVLYLNDILCIVRSVPELRSRYKTLLCKTASGNSSRELFDYFGEEETLWEVWKCWGSLWFDRVYPKGDYSTVFETGIKSNIFDTPLSGAIYNSHEDGERYIRILLLGGYICDFFPEFGLKKFDNIFRFEFQTDAVSINSNNLTYFTYFMRDSRLQPLLKFSGYVESNNEFKKGIAKEDRNLSSADKSDDLDVPAILDRSISKGKGGADSVSPDTNEEEDDDDDDDEENDDAETNTNTTTTTNTTNTNKHTVNITNSMNHHTNQNQNDNNNNNHSFSDVDLAKWTGENDSPKLPMWDHNSYGFMTDFINNQYPAVLAHRSSLELLSFGTNEDDNEYEEDSEEDFDENENSDDQYQGTDQYDITSEGGSVSAKAPLSRNAGAGGTSSSEGGNYKLSSVKPVVIKGDLGDHMDTSITFISLDTNVWLKHCGKIFKCVRARIFKLAIPLTVFQELRSLRKSNDSLVAESATRAVIIARQLYAENVALAIRADGTTASHINETREFEQNENWRLNSDELILQSVKLNDAFGKSLSLGYGYSVGELPQLPLFEEPGRVAGVYNGAYRGGYSLSHFPTSRNPSSLAAGPSAAVGPDTTTTTTASTVNSVGHTGTITKSDGTRGEALRPLFVASKHTMLSKADAAEFRYNIVVTDDHDMCLRAEAIGLKHLRSSEWFKTVDRISFGRCYD